MRCSLWRRAGPRKVDLGGNTVLPGFIDAHTHPAMAGLDHLRMVDCDLRSIADILSALRKRAAQTAPGEWVLGFKYDDTKTSTAVLSRLQISTAQFRIIPSSSSIAGDILPG